jgi:transposase-like protein
LYPVIYLDALVVKVKGRAHVRDKAAHVAVGVNLDGIRDVLILCCDGPTGFPEAIEAT